MNNKRQRNWLFTMLMLVMAMLVPQWTWAQTASQPQSGDGTTDSPYIITKAEELAWFRDQVNSGNNSICAKIDDDVVKIDLKDFCHAADASQGIEELSWEPIGNLTYTYEGTFDGNGKIITNLYINASKSYMGFFGFINRCTIKNLIFQSASVTNTSDNTGILVGSTGGDDNSILNIMIYYNCHVNGGDTTGGIAGKLDGDASNCENYADVQGAEGVGGLFGSYSRTGNSMTACANYGNITATSQMVGGLVGYFSGGTIQDCANYGDVKGTDRVAGMAGFVDQCKIQNVFSYGGICATYNTQDAGMVFGYSNNGTTEGTVAYYSGAKLTVNGQEITAKAFGKSKLSEDNATGFTEAQLSSGLVAYLLQQSASSEAKWGQDLGDTQNAYPVLGSKYKVYPNGYVTLSCTGTLEGQMTNDETEGTFIKVHTGSKTHHEAVTATCTQDGSIEYWTCSDCNRIFSDEQLTQAVGSTTVAATGHDYDSDDKCTKCKQTIPVLTLGNNKVNINKAVGTRDQITGYDLFKYTPKEDGTLEVTASSGEDTYGTLWGSRTDSEPLTSDDSGNYYDFKLTYTVTKGSTYYIGARDYDGNAINGDVMLYVTMNGLDAELPEGISGLGTAESPFALSTAEHLAWFRDKVNGGNNSICAKIADDVDAIDMTTVCHAADASNGIEELSWEPIGNDNKHPFTGSFTGNGKTISNLYIKTENRYVGFFGYTYESVIKDITFQNAKVESYSWEAGILAGILDANARITGIKTLADCSITGTAKTGSIVGYAAGSDISNSENHATVNGTSCVGGICGMNDGADSSISSCANYGTVSGTDYAAGGMIGYFSNGTVQDCANYGGVNATHSVGGIAGFVDQGKIRNVLGCGNVNATKEKEICGIIIGNSNKGTAEGVVAFNSEATLTSGTDGNKTVLEARAFGKGNITSDAATGCTTEQLRSGEVAYLLNGSTSAPAEGETLKWYQKLGDNADAYPVLTSTGDNTVYNATLISCDGVSTLGEYANNPEGDKLTHNYQMATTPDEGTTNLYSDICTLCKSASKDTKYIKDFCGIEGNNVILTAGTDGSYTATEAVSINDAAAYDSPVDFTAPKLNYTRNYLGNNKWQAVYVPFEADATDWTDNGITVASINNFHEYEKEDGSGYETVLEVKKATSGEFEANTPYVARTSESGSKTITINNVKLHKAASESYYCMSMTRRYDFTGIYTPQSGLGQNDISAVYALDKQGRMAPLRPATELGAQRWYLTVSDRNGSSLPQEFIAHSIRIDMTGEGETTGIKDIQVISNNGLDNTGKTGIYDLQGRKLSKEPTHGIYIKNGKKYVK